MKIKSLKKIIMSVPFITAILMLGLYFLFNIIICNVVAQNYYQIIKKHSYHYIDQFIETYSIKTDSGLKNGSDHTIYYLDNLINAISDQTELIEYASPKYSMDILNPQNPRIEVAAIIRDETGAILYETERNQDLLIDLKEYNYGKFNDKEDLTSFTYHNTRIITINNNDFYLDYVIWANPMKTAKDKLFYIRNWSLVILIAVWYMINLCTHRAIYHKK